MWHHGFGTRIFLVFLCLSKIKNQKLHNVAPYIKYNFMQIGSRVNKRNRNIQVSCGGVGNLELIQQLCGHFLKPEIKFVIFRVRNYLDFELDRLSCRSPRNNHDDNDSCFTQYAWSMSVCVWGGIQQVSCIWKKVEKKTTSESKRLALRL